MFFHLLIFSCGILNAVHASSLIFDTLKCSRYWPQHMDHQDRRIKLPDTIESLNQMCQYHQRFFNCVRNVSRRIGDNQLPHSVKRSENLSNVICKKDIRSKESYLETARCINRMNQKFCSLPGMDDKYESKHKDACELRKKAVGCFAFSLSSTCDYNAFNIFLSYYIMLHWDADECDFATPDFTPGSYSQYYTYQEPSNRRIQTVRYNEDGEIEVVDIPHNDGTVFVPNKKDVLERKDDPLYKAIKTTLDFLIDYMNELSNNTSGSKLHEITKSPENAKFVQGNHKQTYSSISGSEKMVQENYADYNSIIHCLLSTYESTPSNPKDGLANLKTESSAMNRHDFQCGVKPLRNLGPVMVDNPLITENVGREKIYPQLKTNMYERYPKKTTSKQWINKPPASITINRNMKNEYCSKDGYICLNDGDDLGSPVDSDFEKNENSELKFFDVYRTGNLVDTSNLGGTLESKLEDVSDEPYVRAEDMTETDSPTIQTSTKPSNVFIATENGYEKIRSISDNVRSELVKLFSIPALDYFKIVQQPNFRLEFKTRQDFPNIEVITCERIRECDPNVKEAFKCSIIPRDTEKDFQNEISQELSRLEENLKEKIQNEVHDQKLVKISDIADYVRSARNNMDMQTADNTVSQDEKESDHSYERDSNVEFETPEISLSTESPDDLQLYLISTNEESIQHLTEDPQLVLIDESVDDQPEFVYSVAEPNICDSDNKSQLNRLQSDSEQ